MKVLWCCNVILPEIADAAGISEMAHSAGWIEGFLHGIKAQKDVELGIICPGNKETHGAFDGIEYWICGSESYKSILDAFSPDIVHVFGTENEESNKLVSLFNNKSRTVINIQGMAGLCADVYIDGLPITLQRKQRFFEKIIGNGILNQRDNLQLRGNKEAETFSIAGHVIGRTDIDRMFALDLNPNIQYHCCNEILRANFYSAPKWDISQIKRHSIVIRNTGNPIKGLYQMFCAMPDILKRFPDAHLYVLGNTYKVPRNWRQRVTEGSYNKLLRQTAEKFGLTKCITATGSLNAQQVEELYLQSHVVVSASVIENESNVVSEAKLLGVPVVSSFVGGLPNRITHGEDGCLYPFNMPKMMAYYITELFSDDNRAIGISKKAIASQSIINDAERNIETLVKIYKEIVQAG